MQDVQFNDLSWRFTTEMICTYLFIDNLIVDLNDYQVMFCAGMEL